MRANIEIDGTEVVFRLDYNGETLCASCEVDPDIIGYTWTWANGDFDDYIGRLPDALFVAMEELENAVAAVAYLSMLN